MGGLVSSMKDMRTITHRLLYLSETDPDKELYVFYNRGQRVAFSSERLFTMAGRFANRLRRHGFQDGDVIANTLPNSPERLVTDVGILMAGCITMNGQVLLADGSDFFPTANISGCRALVLSSDGPVWSLVKPLLSESLKDGFISELRVGDAPKMSSAIVVTRDEVGPIRPLLKDLESGEEEVYICSAHPNDVIIVMTTSGTTGYSKLVPRTHQEIIIFSEYQSQIASPQVEWCTTKGKSYKYYSDRLLGWIGGVSFLSLCQAETRVLLDVFLHSPDRHPSTEVWFAMETERCQMCIFQPLEFENIYKCVQSMGGPINKLDLMVTGGQPIRKSQLSKFFELSNRVCSVYGSTEAGYIAVTVPIADEYESNNCGKLWNDVELRILSEDGALCGTNETGTIHVKGRNVFKGYFNCLENPDPQTSNAFTTDGWFNMEDYGYVNEVGDLFVFGRVKDVITYGSFVFYPGWMERKLVEHTDILEALLVPVSHPLLYHNICACIKLTRNSQMTEDDIRAYCDKIFLPDVTAALVPKPEYFMIMKEEFPISATGKPDKKLLKQIAENIFGKTT